MKSMRAQSGRKTPSLRPDRPLVPRGECLATRTLLAIARQRRGFDAGGCGVVFGLLDAAAQVDASLRWTLGARALTEAEFAVLVALFAVEPEPVTPADLADYTAASRPVVTATLRRLAARGLITRGRDPSAPGGCPLQLTKRGRLLTDAAVETFLAVAGRVARRMKPVARTRLLSSCRDLRQGAAAVLSRP